MKSKKQFLNKECTYDDYISQFVDEGVKRRVLQLFKIEELMNSTDQHFNDLPLTRWDRLTGYGMKGIKQRADIYQKIRDAGDSPTYSIYTAIYKMAARQLVSEHKSQLK